MFETIDTIARIVGYLTIIYGVIRFANKVSDNRNATRAYVADRDEMERLRTSDPQRYEREVWWRDNERRHRAGLPTDPEFDRQAAKMYASMKDAMSESSGNQDAGR